MPRIRRFVLPTLGFLLVCILVIGSWLQWSQWPDPEAMPRFTDADALVILGGGDYNRWDKAYEMAAAHPGLPLIVTGDENHIVGYLTGKGIPRERILHEPAATSTVENAKFTKPMLDKIVANRVILVTNWFHTPRSLAIFRKYQPGRAFTVSFSPKPETLTRWDRLALRRERMAALHNLVVHRVWSFCGRKQGSADGDR